jgi:hypothetical protein
MIYGVVESKVQRNWDLIISGRVRNYRWVGEAYLVLSQYMALGQYPILIPTQILIFGPWTFREGPTTE